MAETGGNRAEGILIARVVTALKLAVSWFFLSVVMHAWYTDKITRGRTGWESFFSGVWSGETTSRAKNRVPVTLHLVIEIRRDHTYAITHKSFVHILEMLNTWYWEEGFWDIQEGRFRTVPKVCQGIVNVENGRKGRVPCPGGDSWSLDLKEDGIRIWSVEESFGETRYTFPMQRIN